MNQYISERIVLAEPPMFEPKTRGGHEYVIYKIFPPDEARGKYAVHGAVKHADGAWIIESWHMNGSCWDEGEDNCDLLPRKPKKRRFKTAEELVENKYGLISFTCNGDIIVNHCGGLFQRSISDTPEGNYTEEWLGVFTVEEE